MSYILLADVKSYLKITKSDYDTILGKFITSIETHLKLLLNQPIQQEGLVLKKLDIEGDYIVLPYTVPTVVSSVQYTLPFESTLYTLTETTDYVIFYEGYVQKIWIKGGINKDYVWKISVAAGWATAAIPDDLIQVGIEMVSMKFKESVVGDNILGKSNVSSSMSGGSSTTSYKDMMTEWNKVLNKYKIYSI